MSDIERTAELCPNPGQPQDASAKPQPAPIKAPDGVEIDLVVYLHSDAEEIDVAIGLRGMTGLKPFDPAFDWSALVGSAVSSLRELADDWRVMSRAEIAAYKRSQGELGDG